MGWLPGASSGALLGKGATHPLRCPGKEAPALLPQNREAVDGEIKPPPGRKVRRAPWIVNPSPHSQSSSAQEGAAEPDSEPRALAPRCRAAELAPGVLLVTASLPTCPWALGGCGRQGGLAFHLTPSAVHPRGAATSGEAGNLEHPAPWMVGPLSSLKPVPAE